MTCRSAQQGFGRGKLPNLDKWASLTKEEKMFMVFQQIQLLRENAVVAYETLEHTQGLLLSRNDAARDERARLQGMLTEALGALRESTVRGVGGTATLTTEKGEVKLNTKQPRVAAPRPTTGIQNSWTSSSRTVGLTSGGTRPMTRTSPVSPSPCPT
jgi:hypothetical protein